ncbi:MAG: division/cell wall cluster transcriptional repressor MraZ [Anaerolineales bacterium]
MFLGQYTHSIDTKGRLSVPARFRELLEAGAYITQGFDQNLMVLTTAAFERLSTRVNEMSLTDPTARQLKRLLFATADRIELDSSGRMRIPQFLREVAGLNGDAVIIGAGDYFEIWAPAAWQPKAAELQDTEANAQRFAALELTS